MNREMRFLEEGYELHPILMETQTLCGIDIDKASKLIMEQGYTISSFQYIQQDIREYAAYWLSTVIAFQALAIFILMNLKFNPYVLGAGIPLLLVGCVVVCVCVHIYRNGCRDANGTRVLLREGIIVSASGNRLICMTADCTPIGDVADKAG